MAADPNADYTREDANPLETSFEVPDVEASDKTPEQIRAENTFTAPPPGEHILEVQGFPYPVKPLHVEVTLDGQPASYDTIEVSVRFQVPGNPKQTVDDNFKLPPASPAQVAAYHKGIAMSRSGKPLNPGFESDKYFQFMAALGWDYKKTGKLPPEARSSSNWIGRKLIATVQGATPYVDGNGVSKEGKARMKLFSYRPAVGGAPPSGPIGTSPVGPGGGGNLADAIAPARGNPGRRNAAPVAVTADTGVDDI